MMINEKLKTATVKSLAEVIGKLQLAIHLLEEMGK
jgi:hypothetical protein